MTTANNSSPEGRQKNTPPRQYKIKAAVAFLRVAMQNGPRWAAEVEAEAKNAGHAYGTLVHAKKRAHIHSERKNNRWIWSTTAQHKQPVKPQGTN